MKKLSGSIVLLVLLFSVTTALSADSPELPNLFVQGSMETTIFQNLGGLAIIDDSERLAVPVESILQAECSGAVLAVLSGVSGEYIIYENGKLFVHPAVLGIC